MNIMLSQNILAFFKESWAWIAGVGAILGIVGFVLQTQERLFSSDNECKKVSSKIIKAIFALTSLFFICFAIFALYIEVAYTEVPSVEGQDLKDAKRYVEEADLVPDLQPNVNVTSDRNEVVLGSSPESGSILKTGSTVELITNMALYNSGSNEINAAEPVEVPNVVGMEQLEATSLIESCGLQFQVWWTDDIGGSSNSPWYIKSQSIPSGSIVDSGTLVKLELTKENTLLDETTYITSESSNKISVPYVIGMEQVEAKMLLEADGFNVEVYVAEENLVESNKSLYYVIGQSISSGSLVDIGTLIELKIAGEDMY